jgi:hypothetical protein
MRCKIDVIIRIKMSCRVNKQFFDILLTLGGIVKVACGKVVSPLSDVKNVCNKRLLVSMFPKLCIREDFVCLNHRAPKQPNVNDVEYKSMSLRRFKKLENFFDRRNKSLVRRMLVRSEIEVRRPVFAVENDDEINNNRCEFWRVLDTITSFNCSRQFRNSEEIDREY